MTISEYLAFSPGAWISVAVVLGFIVGSFLNVVIYRLPMMLDRGWKVECRELLEIKSDEPEAEPFNLVVPRSRCPQCRTPIRARDNVPVLSYLALRGKCADCGEAISMRYPAVELLSGLLCGIVAWRFGYGAAAGAAMLFTWAMICLSFIDFDHQWLPDAITLPFLWLGLVLNLFGVFSEISAAVIGAVAGYMILWIVFHAFRLVTGKEGMGYGDFKLLALVGAWAGWSILPATVLLSSLAGAILGIGMIVFGGRDRAKPIPFGPYLAIAGWIALLWGESINRLYLGTMIS